MDAGNPLLNQLIALLRDRSLRLGTFTLASGRSSSFYIDARQTTMSAAGLEVVGELGLATIREAGWRPECVGGLTLGADPVSYAIALASRHAPPALDAFTVRKAAKTHGTGRRIEGCFRPGAATVIVEDVITSGASALEAIAAVRAAQGLVLGVVAVVDREEGGRRAIEDAGFAVRALVSARSLGVTAPAT